MTVNRSMFVNGLTDEVDKLQRDTRFAFNPSRLRWFLSALRTCGTDSAMAMIEIAEELYQDEVRSESDRREARRVANDALRFAHGEKFLASAKYPMRDDNEGMRPDDHPLWDANPLGGTEA